MKIRIILLSLLSIISLVSCKKVEDSSSITSIDENIKIMLINDDTFETVGGNIIYINPNEGFQFTIKLKEGYEIDYIMGADCNFSAISNWTQTISCDSALYDTSIRVITKRIETFDLFINTISNQGEVIKNTNLSSNLSNKIYINDQVELIATPKEGYCFSGWSYNDYLDNGGNYFSGEPKISFTASQNYEVYANFEEIGTGSISYNYNGGIDSLNRGLVVINYSSMLEHHLRPNTSIGEDISKFGYSLVGWNTKKDGTGEHIGLGSKTFIDEQGATYLYAEWKKDNNPSDFEFFEGTITKYVGKNKTHEIVIPSIIDGIPVTSIASKAFENVDVDIVYLPNSINVINNFAFENSFIKELYIFDNVSYIDELSFSGCNNFKTIHINAKLKPCFTDSIYASKYEIYDRIIINKEKTKNKIVFFGGSSCQMGYQSEITDNMFNNAYEVYNLGIIITINGYPIMEMINPYMKQGDVFIHAAEPYGNVWSGNPIVSDINKQVVYDFETAESIFFIFESNLDMLSHLNMQKYGNFFDFFRNFNGLKINLNKSGGNKSYDSYDSSMDGMPYHNDYGDINMDAPQQDVDKAFNLNYINYNYVGDFNLLGAKEMYTKFIDKGVVTCSTFAPINYRYMYDNYGDSFVDIASNYTDLVRKNLEPEVCVLLSQIDTIYEAKYFFNTDLHLGHQMACEHTKKVISALQVELERKGYVW